MGGHQKIMIFVVSVCEDYCSRTWNHTLFIIDKGYEPEDGVKGKICAAERTLDKKLFFSRFWKINIRFGRGGLYSDTNCGKTTPWKQ